MRRIRLACTSLAAFVALFALGCPKSTTDARDGGTTADAATPASLAAGDGGGRDGGGGEDVEPVYPIEANAPPEPLAEKLCNALTTMPEQKRSACCKTTPSIVITAECTRQLSAAIRHGALAVDVKDVDTCLAAYEKTLEGCDWVGPFPPGPPAACQGIFRGKLAAGQRCRSSLECAGELRCKDLGPTTPGRCSPAGTGEETSCGGTVDSLATYTLQSDVDARHPECKERCIEHKCRAPVREGGACLISGDCQDGLQCLPLPGAPRTGNPPRTCVAARLPAKEGEACPGGVCDGSLQCIRGTCAARKNTGETCADDFECRGGCLKDGETNGRCGPRCDLR